MQVRFLESAQLELDEAIAYYNAEMPDLGRAFLLELLASLERVCQFPNAWHPISTNTRRCQLRRFSYGVIYAQMNGAILVVAIGHLHRSPEYWQNLNSRILK